MHRPIYILEALGTLTQLGLELEVCATAEGHHDAAAGKLEVELDCYVRPVDLKEKEWHRHPDWLPTPQKASEGVAEEEASDLLRDVFHRWANRVRDALTAERERAASSPGT